MNMLILTLMFYLMSNFKSEYILFKPFLMLRNSALRVLISREFQKYKNRLYITNRVTKKNASTYYNSLISKYYCISYDYYSLSEDDKTIIETIISLAY